MLLCKSSLTRKETDKELNKYISIPLLDPSPYLKKPFSSYKTKICSPLKNRHHKKTKYYRNWLIKIGKKFLPKAKLKNALTDSHTKQKWTWNGIRNNKQTLPYKNVKTYLLINQLRVHQKCVKVVNKNTIVVEITF